MSLCSATLREQHKTVTIITSFTYFITLVLLYIVDYYAFIIIYISIIYCKYFIYGHVLSRI